MGDYIDGNLTSEIRRADTAAGIFLIQFRFAIKDTLAGLGTLTPDTSCKRVKILKTSTLNRGVGEILYPESPQRQIRFTHVLIEIFDAKRR